MYIRVTPAGDFKLFFIPRTKSNEQKYLADIFKLNEKRPRKEESDVESFDEEGHPASI